MLIVIPTGVYVHTCEILSPGWGKSSLLRMSALHFQDREDHTVFLISVCSPVNRSSGWLGHLHYSSGQRGLPASHCWEDAPVIIVCPRYF